MPNMAAVLKTEIQRLARKEVKALTSGTKQAAVQCRRDVAQLRRVVQEQQKKLAFFAGRLQDRTSQRTAEEEPLAGVRFSSRSVRAQRKRLGLSADDYGRLVGVSGLTIYNWEHGRARPRKAQLAALIAVRHLGKREAKKRLEMLSGQRGNSRRS